MSTDRRPERPRRGRPIQGEAPAVPGVELSAILGRGGMGIVYRGRQGYLDREVAVKFLDVRTARGEFESRFRREARLLAGMTHPNIVACYQAGTTDEGFCYLVMEFIDGPDLKVWIEENGALEPEIAVSVCRDVALALHHAQHMSIIHRDVKPANVFLGHDPDLAKADDPFPFRVKLGDLGLARPTTNEVEGAEEMTQLTQGWVGSPATMAPEQFDDGKSVDHRADIYGLGCVLYQALTGEVAYKGSHSAVIKQKMERYGPDPRATRPDLPKPLGHLVRRMMAHDPEERPQTYEEVLEAFDSFLDGPEVAAGGKSRAPLWVGVAAVAAAAVGFAVWKFLPRGGTTADLVLDYPRTVRSGWPVELASTEKLDDWEWDWELVGATDDVRLEGDRESAVRFVAPLVSQAETLELRARALPRDGSRQFREALAEVRVLPPLALALDGPEALDEDQAAEFTVRATSDEPPLGDVTYRWTSEPALPGVPEAQDRLATTPPQAAADYDVALTVVAFEGEREAGRLERTVRVRASDDPPRLEGIVGDHRVARPGQMVELGARASDPEGGALEVSWSIDDAQSVLDPDARAALVAALGSESLVTVEAPRAGSKAVLALDVRDAAGQSATQTFQLDVPSVTVEAPTAVGEGETIALAAVPPSDFPAFSELTFAWRLASVEWADTPGSLVVREGAAPASPGTRPTPPELCNASAWTAERFDLVAGGWDQPRLEVAAPLADRPYTLGFELTISRNGAVEAETGATVRVDADDADTALFLVAPSGPIEPLSEVTVEAALFDPDSDVRQALATLRWDAPARADAAGPKAAVRAPATGEFQVRAQVGALEASLPLRVTGGVRLALEGQRNAREGDPLRLTAAVDGLSDAATTRACEVTWRLVRVPEPALWEPQAPGADGPKAWAGRDELSAGVQGTELAFAAPLAAQPYTLELRATARLDGQQIAEETFAIEVDAQDAPATFDPSGLPEAVSFGDPLAGAVRVRDEDSLLGRFRWLQVGSQETQLGADGVLSADGLAALPKDLALPVGPARLVLVVRDAKGDDQRSPIFTVTVLPPPSVELAATPLEAREGATFRLAGETVGMPDAAIEWKVVAVRPAKGNQGPLHLAPADGSAEPKAYDPTMREAIAGWLGPRTTTGEAFDLPLVAPSADGPYELVLEITAKSGALEKSAEQLVRVAAEDTPGRIELPRSLTAAPGRVALAATLVDPDSTTLGRELRWRVVDGPGTVTAEANGRAVLDVAAVPKRAWVTLEAEVASGPPAEAARTSVLVDPTLGGFPGKLDLLPDRDEGYATEWMPTLCALDGATEKLDDGQLPTLPRHRNEDAWAYFTKRPAGSLVLVEHAVPSAPFEARLDLGRRSAFMRGPLLELGICVRESTAPHGTGRAYTLRMRDQDQGEPVLELVQLDLTAIPVAELPSKLDGLPNPLLATSNEEVVEGPLAGTVEGCFDQREPDDNVPESAWMQYGRVEVRWKDGRLTLRFGATEASVVPPSDFQPGVLGIWVRNEWTLFVRDVTLEPAR